MVRFKPSRFFLAFTEGWGDEPIIECTSESEFSGDPRLILCRADPAVIVESQFSRDGREHHFDHIVIFDRFNEGRWRHPDSPTNVGVLAGEIDTRSRRPLDSLELMYWATAFSTREEAELARNKLRSASNNLRRD
jgi:hypothetical protein